MRNIRLYSRNPRFVHETIEAALKRARGEAGTARNDPEEGTGGEKAGMSLS